MFVVPVPKAWHLHVYTATLDPRVMCIKLLKVPCLHLFLPTIRIDTFVSKKCFVVDVGKR